MPVTEAEVVTAPDMTRAVWQLISCYALLRHRCAALDFRPYGFSLILVFVLRFMRYVCFCLALDFRPYGFWFHSCFFVFRRMKYVCFRILLEIWSGRSECTFELCAVFCRRVVLQLRGFVIGFSYDGSFCFWTLISWVLKVVSVIFVRNIKSFCIFLRFITRYTLT